MRYKLILICLIFSLSIGTAQNADSIKKIDKVDDSSKTERVHSTSDEKPESENRFDNYIIALIGLFGVILASIISYRIANNQNRNKLLETKISFLTSQKGKLENLKSQIYDRQVDVSNNTNLNADLMRSKFIDRLLQDISSLQKHSELFEKEFIDELNSYSQRMSTYIFQAKSGVNLDNNGSIKTDIENVPTYDNKIKSVIDLKINEFNVKINELIDKLRYITKTVCQLGFRCGHQSL